MEEGSQAKAGLLFLWDEAWFGFARWESVLPPADKRLERALLLDGKFKNAAYRAGRTRAREGSGSQSRSQRPKNSSRGLAYSPTRQRSDLAGLTKQIRLQNSIVLPAARVDGACKKTRILTPSKNSSMKRCQHEFQIT